MQIAIEKHSRLAIHRGEVLELTPQGLRTAHFIDPDLTPDNCDVFPCPPLPGYWLPGAYKLVGDALVVTTDGAAALAAEAERLAQQEAEAQAQAAQAEPQTIAAKTDALWQAADRYTTSYISGVAVGILTIGVMLGKPKCAAVAGWSGAVWAEYYRRKSLVTVDSTDDHDFSTFGTMPHSVPELQAEVGM